MNGRILRIELRRSIAPWAGGLFLVAALASLYLFGGPWWNGTKLWTAQWTSMVQWERYLLTFLWPLMVGVGALQGLRDRRSEVSELFATTPRPAWHRAAKTAGALALLLAAAYLLLFLVGGVQVIGNNGYLHLSWLPILAVGVLAIVAGGWLGMGVGRALPSVLTPPALAAAALMALVFLYGEAVMAGRTPDRITLLSPALINVRDVTLVVAGRVNLGQGVWLAGLAATGFLLLVAAGARARLLALLPAVLGVAVALPLLPPGRGQTYVLNEAAAAPVCAGQVCVMKIHEPRLAVLAGPAREALRLLGKLPDPPTSVREVSGWWKPDETSPQRAGVVFVDFDDPAISGATEEELTRSLVAGAGTPLCFEENAEGDDGSVRLQAARTVAAAWLIGDLKPLRDTDSPDEVEAMTRPAWRALRAAPADEQRTRVAAMRKAALSCDGDLLDVLTGDGSR
ncbi:hypothetical protein ACWDOR_05085 [Streptosporangium canum]|uniref:hypothetical protein n=1 Tax=Streptosporangium canum TaxID=324952 RepID=UPI00379F96B4